MPALLVHVPNGCHSRTAPGQSHEAGNARCWSCLPTPGCVRNGRRAGLKPLSYGVLIAASTLVSPFPYV